MAALIQANGERSSTQQPGNLEPGNTKQCEQWREQIYSRHLSIARYLRNHHARLARTDGYIAANQWLCSQEKALKVGNTGLSCDVSDQEIRDYAESKSKKLEKQIHEAAAVIGTATQADHHRVNEYIREEVEATGIPYPLPASDFSKEEMIAAMVRICKPVWWRRQLRKTATRQYENLARQSGMVSLSSNIYCSDFTLRRRSEQKRRNRRLLESLEAENSQGQVFTLAELADLSVSNPINRRNELMTRIAGFERYVKQRPHSINPITGLVSYVGLFLTLTTPSKYHAMSIRKRANGSRYAFPNPKFNGTDPRQANDYLCDLWSTIRAEWNRRDIYPFGFRMAEPHHDGTPHWHMILFIPENRMIEASYVFQHYALREDSDEAGAEEYRSKIVYIDPTKGSAAGYCAKYVAKNIDGFGLDADLYGRDAIQSAMRIEAWASTWGIRQFQQIGGPSVTVWRETRRIKEEMVDCTLSTEAQAIIDAADSGDWEKYTDLMGGAICPLKDRPIRPKMLTKETENDYGEFAKVLEGLLIGTTTIRTRQESWHIQPVGTAESRNDAGHWVTSLNGFYPSQPQAA